jgi:hypothetical protein
MTLSQLFKAALAASLILSFSSETNAVNAVDAPLTPAQAAAPTFSAQVSAAPANGASLSGDVRLEVRGSNLQNVELLPASGYTPRLGVFNISPDKTFAWLDLDTKLLAISTTAATVRISAFNVPAGQPGASEIVAMPPRTWSVTNAQPPTGALTAGVVAAPSNNAAVQGIVHLEVFGNRIKNVELLPATGYLPRFGTFNVSADGSTASLDFDSRSLPDGMRDVRISAFSTLPGQPVNVAEYVAMPARRWIFNNGSTSAFTVSGTTAPLHGETISGVVRLEIRGNGIQNAELLPPAGYSPKLGVFNVTSDRTYAWLDLNTQLFPNGPLDARISVFNVPAGQPGAQEIVAVPARQWNILHG